MKPGKPLPRILVLAFVAAVAFEFVAPTPLGLRKTDETFERAGEGVGATQNELPHSSSLDASSFFLGSDEPASDSGPVEDHELHSQTPSRARELLGQVESEVVSNSLHSSLQADWFQRDPAAALQWLRLSRDPRVTDDQICAAVEACASTDPLAALENLVWLVQSDEQVARTLPIIFSRWAEKAPREAAEAVAILPDDDLRQAAVKPVMQTWIRKDATSAYIWMKSLPEFDELVAQLPSG